MSAGTGWPTQQALNQTFNANDEEAEELGMDTTKANAENVGSSLYVEKKGQYHLEIAAAKYRPERYYKEDDGTESDKERVPDILAVCKVLHSAPGQSPQGSTLMHNVDLAGRGGEPYEDWRREATLNFLTGIGVLRKIDGKIVNSAGSTKIVFNQAFSDSLVGIQFIADVKHTPAKTVPGKVPGSAPKTFEESWGLPFGRGAFTVDDLQVREVPKNLAALELIGMAHCMPAPVVQGSQAAAGGAATATEGEAKGKRGRKAKQATDGPATTAQAPAQSTPQPALAPVTVQPLPTQTTLPLSLTQQATQAPLQAAVPAAAADDLEGF